MSENGLGVILGVGVAAIIVLFVLAAATSKRCPSCGVYNPRNRSRCEKCGAWLE